MKTTMKKSLTTLIFLLLFPSAARAIYCPPDTVQGPACDGHKHLYGSTYPYTLDFNDGPVTVNYQAWPPAYTPVAQGCSHPSRNYINFRHTANVNAVFRGWVQLSAASTAPVGSKFAIRFTVDGVSGGEYLRAVTGQYPQGEDVSVVWPNLAFGNHQVRLEVWLYEGSGSIEVSQAFLIGNGAPTEYGAGSWANNTVTTIDGTWRQISNTLSFTASTDVNLLVQGYFQINSGTPGQKLSVGFSLDGANPQHTIELGVPAQIPNGINVLDHYKLKPSFLQVPAGSHTLSMRAINLDGGTTTVQYRQVEVIGFAANDPIPDTRTVMKVAEDASAVTATVNGDGSVVFDPLLVYCSGTNKWTKLLQFEYPAVTPEEEQNMVGEAYIEFLGAPAPVSVNVAVEVLYDPTYDQNQNPVAATRTADFTIVSLKIPAGRHQKFVYMHPLKWGTDKPNLVRLFVRPSCGDSGSFTVGKRYMALKAIPITGATGCETD